MMKQLEPIRSHTARLALGLVGVQRKSLSRVDDCNLKHMKLRDIKCGKKFPEGPALIF